MSETIQILQHGEEIYRFTVGGWAVWGLLAVLFGTLASILLGVLR